MFKGNKDNKQYLNLSTFAKDILDYDRYNFGLAREGIVNKILYEYREDADASIALRLQERKSQLYDLCDNIDESTEIFIDKILSHYEKELIGKSSPAEKPFYNKRDDPRYKYVRIHNQNALRIYNTNYCLESAYYNDKACNYIKAIIEEYAKKPFYEREQIMLKRTLEFLQSAIDSGYHLAIKINGKKYEVRPYRIMLDEQNIYHYLVGKSFSYETDAERMMRKSKGEPPPHQDIVSLRVSRLKLKDMRFIKDKERTTKITYFEEQDIKKKISESGVMFLLGHAVKITLILSENGYNKYMLRLNQRPALKALEDPGSFETFCTFRQFHNFFFDFGKDLEIISPVELREAFCKRYKDALANYINE